MNEALLNALIEEAFDTVKNLLNSSQIDVNYQNELGETALHIASLMGNLEIVSHLLEKGANVNALNKEKETPLHKAAYSRRKAVCDLLIKNGANINAQRDDGDTPLNITARLYDLRASLSCKEVCKTIVKAGADINIKNSKGNTPYEFIFGHEDLMFELLQSNSKLVDVNTTKSSTGNTGLHLAVLSGNKALCEVLIRHGADASLKNNFNQSPYDIALSDPWLLKRLGHELIEALKLKAKDKQYTHPDLLMYQKNIEISDEMSKQEQNSK